MKRKSVRGIVLLIAIVVLAIALALSRSTFNAQYNSAQSILDPQGTVQTAPP